MELIDELIDIYLEGVQPEIGYVLDCRNDEVLLDAPQSLTGEPEIDWDGEEASAYLEIPTSSSSEMFQVMMEFAQKQPADKMKVLLVALDGRKPFRQFKDKVLELGIDEEWFKFERLYARNIMIKWLENVRG